MACDDQKPMERCKECNNWTKDRSGRYTTKGRCAILSAENNILKRRERESPLEPMLTWENFICPFFTGKPKGPFATRKVHGEWYIHHLPDESLPIKAPCESEAKTGANWLNKLWERRE